jgi:AcrR family transcriptional regulator
MTTGFASDGPIAIGITFAATTMANTKIKSEAVRVSILEAASNLFIKKGLAGTKMQDIAEALGITRTNVYYYYDNKEQIFEKLTLDLTELAKEVTTTAVRNKDQHPAAMLRSLVIVYSMFVLKQPILFRVSERNEQNLKPKDRNKVMNARRSVLDNFRAVIERGVMSGHLRGIDPAVTAFSIIGICNWSAWWFRPEGKYKVEELAEQIADFVSHAVEQTDRPLRTRRNGREIVKRIRGELDYLENIIAEKSIRS